MRPIIVIVGRPNVGKSTLFNRLSRTRSALVDDAPGVTRDRLYTTITDQDVTMTLVDTGGFDDLGEDPLLEDVKTQIQAAIEEADRVIFMVDGRQGLMPGDLDMAGILRKSRKKVFLAVNKVDGPEHDPLTLDFYALGMDRLYPISAEHGYGVRTLMDDVIEGLSRTSMEEAHDTSIRVAVVGRPNTGKSSLINRILGLDRLLVSDAPGTTRDAVDTPFTWGGKPYLLIDTAGIRRKARVKEKIEKFSVIQTLKSLDRCHVAIILLDAPQGVLDQDARICGYALQRGRAVVLAVNKWDLVRRDKDRVDQLNRSMDRQLQFISFAPRINLSALTGERVMKLIDKIDQVYAQYTQRISTSSLNRALHEWTETHPPPRVGRGRLRFFYATQVRTSPPTFVVFVNRPDMVHFSYRRFLINQIKECFGLSLTPVVVRLKKRV
jgi:GTP-binding protein